MDAPVRSPRNLRNVPLDVKEHMALIDRDAAIWYILYDKEFGDFLVTYPAAYKRLRDKHTVREEHNHPSGGTIERYVFMGNEHRSDGPAWIHWTAPGKMARAEWKQHGVITRNDGPAVIEYHEDGVTPSVETWYQNDVIARDNNQPAIVEYFDDGVLLKEEWFRFGRQDSENGQPTVIVYYHNGRVRMYEWHHHDALDRKDGPAIIRYHDDGTVAAELWYEKGYMNRRQGPSMIYYDENGRVTEVSYYENGLLHRVDGPAHIYYYPTGQLKTEVYYDKGRRHRKGGPAMRTYAPPETATSPTGHITSETYFLGNRQRRPHGLPNYIEYHPDGSIALEYSLTKRDEWQERQYEMGEKYPEIDA